MLLSNPLFDAEKILNELAEKTSLEVLQRKLKVLYFSKPPTENNAALKELQNDYFNEFPRLQHVLHDIFSGKPDFKIPDELNDWAPSVSFATINQKYGYFGTNLDNDLSPLFKRLAIACRKMTSLIERQASDDEMAYKLMALFYDSEQNQDKNFEIISQKFDKVIKTKQDTPIKTPYHEAFVTELNHFPQFSDIKNFQSWQKFITQEGFKALRIFSECAQLQDAFKTIQQAKEFLLKKTYPCAEDHPELAKLCKRMLISNEGFEAGLQEIKNGWPKKQTDNLPIVDIADKTGQFFWVKLPPQDMRALYLGNCIPGCCQFINGDSHQCVKDGIYLSDNGFYVLLKAKKSAANSPRMINGEINDKAYDIVAQSYAWKSTHGNLCLDSLEWDPKRVDISVIRGVMTQFCDQVFTAYPQIKYINVGTGGQTPNNIYPNCDIHETMIQGHMYGDARHQYRIASSISIESQIIALKNRLKPYPADFKKIGLYLAPYFNDIQNIPDALIQINPDIVNELPTFIRRIHLPPSLSVNDFKKISFEDYQTMIQSDQNKISTLCKLFNSNNDATLMKWLPTIPNSELIYIALSDSLTPLTIEVLKKLPTEQRLISINKKDSYGQSALFKAAPNPKSLEIILEIYPPNERLAALKEKNIHGEAALFKAASDPKSLKITLDLLPENQRLEALKEKDRYGDSLLYNVASNHESLKMVLDLYPLNERLEALKEKNSYEMTALFKAASDSKSLQITLDLLPENQRLAALKEKDKYGDSLLYNVTSNHESLKIILELYPPNERLQALKETNNHGMTALFEATSKPKSLKMIFDLLPPKQRLEALQEKDDYKRSLLSKSASNPESLNMILSHYPKYDTRLLASKNKDIYGRSVLFQAASNPESLKIILDLYPPNERLEAVKEKDRYGDSLLYNVAANPKSLKIILDLYPPNERLAALKENNSLLFNPESLKMILELLPKEQRLEALKERDKYNDSALTNATSNPESLKMILELLPEEVSSTIQTYQMKQDVLEYATSIEQFMNDMKGLATPDSISKFVHALINNQDIEKARQSLFTPMTFSSFFSSNKNQAIQKSLDTLHPFWQEQIQLSLPTKKWNLTPSGSAYFQLLCYLSYPVFFIASFFITPSEDNAKKSSATNNNPQRR